MKSPTQHIPPTLPNLDSHSHVRGQSIYVDDIPVRSGTLHAAVFPSPVAHGKIKNLDLSAAQNEPGVLRIFTHADVPGENQIGGILPDEPLFAEGEIHFRGQPIALAVAETEAQARAALHKIKVEIEPLPVITDPREAQAAGQLIIPPRTFRLGDAAAAFQKCEHVFEGIAESGGQEHLYIETQGAYGYPMENGSIRISSSTQGPTAVQRTVAKVLGLPMHKIEVDVTRLGGGFGGKEDQATGWAVMVALAVFHLQKPVKLILHRMDDMAMTGKRHPYSSDYKIGLDAELNIVAYEATYYQNAGAAADLSPAIMERTLFHATNSYFVPNVTATAYSCRTNLPPNTAFRGFGGPQAMFVIEAAIHHAAREMGVPATDIQRKNLLKNGDLFPYGQIAEAKEAIACWDGAAERYHLEEMRKKIADFNAQNDVFKKGLALMPICFGISFTNTQMNNARALVHVYSDGSVGVSTGAVEMGQGVNTKMLQVAADVFGISIKKIKIETTNTTRVANTSPSAASATADLNGKALTIACRQIKGRLQKTAAAELDTKAENIELKNDRVWVSGKPTSLHWEQLVSLAFSQRVNLSAKGHYATPLIHFDKKTEKGHPFAYHVYGTAIITATVDCLRGRYEFDSVKTVHDFGASMNRMIDLGQAEGGIVQGIGWMTMEELMYDKNGRLMSNALSTYKVPDVYSVPKEIDVHFLNTDGSELAIFRSKAVGEPPLMYGIGAYFAILNAMLAFNPNLKLEKFSAPMTPEKVLMGLYGEVERNESLRV
ncbi:MAG TPA: xanthine dehydrogenase [Bacteroidetes bacterium]|nr:xanthine dehydrogenase [Bacteroidota bacterium]